MASKIIVICALATMIQCIAGQKSCDCQYAISNNGGCLVATSAGSIAPSGIALATDVNLAGELDLTGSLPYLSAVAFEGKFDTSGTAPVSYGCGDSVAITQQIGGSSSSSSSGNSGCYSYGCNR